MGSVEDVNFPQFIQLPFFLHVKDNGGYQQDVNCRSKYATDHRQYDWFHHITSNAVTPQDGNQSKKGNTRS